MCKCAEKYVFVVFFAITFCPRERDDCEKETMDLSFPVGDNLDDNDGSSAKHRKIK